MKTFALFFLAGFLIAGWNDLPAANNPPAAKPDPTWTDPQPAAREDPDFTLQGEYGWDTSGQAWGAQVVALGNGRFDAYLLEGGLPGCGWERGQQRMQVSGTRQGATVSFAGADGAWTANLAQGQLTVRRDNAVAARLPRLDRKSPSLGAQPPAGAVVLFDGRSAGEWINGRVENGLLANTDATTKRKFQDYTLHLEFRTPYKPFARGQGRGNSGVYHQGRFETQVLDSFGLTGEMNECGGIYSIARPRVNACLPPLTWQTYDVDFTAARFDAAGKLLQPARATVRLNGVVIHEHQELPHATTAAPITTVTPEPGPIYLQHHGNPVFYRNIWIVPR